MPKSDYYAALLGEINSLRVELPDNSKLVSQLSALERRTSRVTGRDSIDHAPGARDDLANAVAGSHPTRCPEGAGGRSLCSKSPPPRRPGRESRTLRIDADPPAAS